MACKTYYVLHALEHFRKLPANEMFVLFILSSNKGPCEPAQTYTSLRCSHMHIQRLNVDEDSDQKVDNQSQHG